jgi:hypothetical protein
MRAEVHTGTSFPLWNQSYQKHSHKGHLNIPTEFSDPTESALESSWIPYRKCGAPGNTTQTFMQANSDMRIERSTRQAKFTAALGHSYRQGPARKLNSRLHSNTPTVKDRPASSIHVCTRTLLPSRLDPQAQFTAALGHSYRQGSTRKLNSRLHSDTPTVKDRPASSIHGCTRTLLPSRTDPQAQFTAALS